MRPILPLAITLLGLGAAVAAPNSSAVSAPADPALRKAGASVAHPSSVSAATPSTAPAAATSKTDAVASTARAEADAGRAADGQALKPQPPVPVDADTASASAAGSVDDLCNALFMSAEENNLPVPFFANLIWQESRLDNEAISSVGALGIAQFMPQVALEVGLDDPFDPRQAIPASARMLHDLREHFGNLGFVAAAYNAGAHRVNEWLDHRRALPRETRNYVLRVTGRSVEQWRKAPPADYALAFVQRLPCRELPAFADLEQAQQRKLAQEQAAERHAKTEPEQESKPAAKAVKVAKAAARGTPRAHRRAAEGQHGHGHARRERERESVHLAQRKAHRGRHEARRRQHERTRA